MPHKFNAARRHKFPKKRYRVTNWAEYTEILRRRGDLTAHSGHIRPVIPGHPPTRTDLIRPGIPGHPPTP